MAITSPPVCAAWRRVRPQCTRAPRLPARVRRAATVGNGRGMSRTKRSTRPYSLAVSWLKSAVFRRASSLAVMAASSSTS